MNHLAGKHIVLGICGGIAAYKSATLVRLFRKAGAEVQVIMTPSAREFITPLTLATLSRNPVITEFFTANTGEWHSHVDLGLWADCMVVAPATACTIAKMATGVADNMLVTSYLSARSKVFVAPAMDFDMMLHPSTQHNLDTLRSYGNVIIEPAEGELASGLVGKGRMAEPEQIFECIENYFSSKGVMAGKKVLITAGPTYEKIDPVRFVGNYSSGKMGYALADAAADAGAEVTVVSGPVNVEPSNPAVKVVKVESANEMLKHCIELFPDVDVAIMAAAVSDYRPVVCAEKKIKRENRGNITVDFVSNPDIAATLGSMKTDSQTLVGFALETDNEEDHARGKMNRKNLDLVILNSLNDAGAGFGVDTNKVTVISPRGIEWQSGVEPKRAIARQIIQYISKH